MTLCIVGAEGAKFTQAGELRARLRIYRLIKDLAPTRVISGECHLGGIDIWAREAAEDVGVPFRGYPPEKKTWEFYKKRNLAMATDCSHAVCITVARYHSGYRGMRFAMCYHCHTTKHIKSGGCWTVRQAIRLGHTGDIITLDP